MAKTTNRELYERSLRRIYSLSTRQLNMAYITWSYMLMGYEIKEVNENLHTFTMINNNLKGPDALRIVNYSASKTVNLKANLIMLQNDIEKFYMREVDKGINTRLLGGFMRNTSINDVTRYNDILKETAKWLYTYDRAVAHAGDGVIKNSLEIKNEMTGRYVGSRILDLIGDVYDVNAKHMETLLSHNTKARPCNLMKSSANTYSYIHEGVPAVIAAQNEEEAELKINQKYISSSMKKWDRNNQIIELEVDGAGFANNVAVDTQQPVKRSILQNEEIATIEEKSPFPVKVRPFNPHINERNEMVYNENVGQQYFDFFSSNRDGAEK